MNALGRAKAALETLSTVLVIVAASGLVWTLFVKRPAEPPPPPPPVTDVNETIAAKHLTNVEGSGPLAIVEFTDFQCPFCARHASSTLPTKKELLDSGKARYVAMNLPLGMHPHALPAGDALRAKAGVFTFGWTPDRLFTPAEAARRGQGSVKG